MKAAVWHGGQKITVENRPEPVTQDGWALVRIELTGLCGTDLAIISSHHQRARPPLVLGHEMVGIVETVGGPGAPTGSRVAINPLLPCGQCWPCLHGLAHTCRELQLLGIDRDGSLAEIVAVPTSALVLVDPGTPPQLAALVEPLAVAVHAARQAAIEHGNSVMIFGAGPIGILTGLVAQAAGAGPVIVAEPNAERRAIAEMAGFASVGTSGPNTADQVLDLTLGVGADITFDTAGHPAVPPLLSAVTRVHGTIVIAGLHHKPATIDLHALTFAEQRLVGSRVYTPADFRAAVAAVDADTLCLHRLPVRVLPLEQVSEAFVSASTHPEVVKVMIASRQVEPLRQGASGAHSRDHRQPPTSED